MHGIFTCIRVVSGVNVGLDSIGGVFGIWLNKCNYCKILTPWNPLQTLGLGVQSSKPPPAKQNTLLTSPNRPPHVPERNKELRVLTVE